MALERGVFRPHDLLWVTRLEPVADLAGMASEATRQHGAAHSAAHSAAHAADMPEWVTAAWLAQAPVVVRRAVVPGTGVPHQEDALIAVGLRGLARRDRVAAVVRRADVLRWVSPESLVPDGERDGQFGALPLSALLSTLAPTPPAVEALTRLAALLHASGLCWGPTGGVGFALASGLPVLRPDSDLDLVVRADMPLTREQCRCLTTALHYPACRVDIQIDTGLAGFAYAEWLRCSPLRKSIMLKTNYGPLLSVDPWDTLQLECQATEARCN